MSTPAGVTAEKIAKEKGLLDVHDLATRFGVGLYSAGRREWRRRMGIPQIRIGNKCYFRESDVNEAIARLSARIDDATNKMEV